MDCVKLVCFLVFTVIFAKCEGSLWDSYTSEESSEDYYDYTNVIPLETTTEQIEDVTTEIDFGVNLTTEPTEESPINNSVHECDGSSEKLYRYSTGIPEESEAKPVDSEIKLEIENLKGIVNKMSAELIKSQLQITELEKTNKRQHDKIEFLEQQLKTNSIIIFNLPRSRHETHKTTLSKVLHFLKKVMKVQLSAEDIAVALRVDTDNDADHTPILVRFVNFATKMRVLAAQSHLQGSEITVESDYSEGVARDRAQLIPYMMAARNEGLRAFLLYDRLVINGVKYSLLDLLSRPVYHPVSHQPLFVNMNGQNNYQ